ncbi:MAG: amidase [Gammaproteobacteria bacterium]|nr:amidase [Gammaproteobacteria bacterium]
MYTTRRRLLKYSASLLATPLLPAPARAAIRLGTRRTEDELCALGATDAIALMKSGDLRAEDYAAALLARAEHKKNLNAFIALDPEQVLEAARAADKLRASGNPLGRLHGLAVPVKDSILTADYPTTAGTKAFGPLSPRRDAPIVRRLREQGAIVMGKTNLHELSSGFTSNNEIFGPVRNPYDLARIPGGSSGGTAAAIASGIAPLGIAEDTAGSIRVPAALCGVFGFRPTVGRYPVEDVAPLVPLFDTLGPHARDVRDIVIFDSVLTGLPASPKPVSLDGVRLGVPRTYFYEGVASEASIVIENTLVALEESGAILAEADIRDAKTLIEQTFMPILFHDTYGVLDAWFKSVGVSGGLETILVEAGLRIREAYTTVLSPDGPSAIPREVYENAINVARPALKQAIQRYFADNRLDAMIVPATLCAAPLIGEENETTIDGRKVSIFDALGHNAVLAPSCGLPALTVPAGLTKSGLPVAIEVDVLAGGDEKLLALGLGIRESAFG